MKNYKLLLFSCLGLLISSCGSIEKKFVKKPIESAALCKKYFPTRELSYKEVVRIKRDTTFIKGDSIECPAPYIIYDTIYPDGKKESLKKDLKPSKVKCPDQKTITDSIFTDKEVIVKDTSTEVILDACEKTNIENGYKIKDLNEKLKKKNNTIFYLWLIIGGYLALKAIIYYVKNKTRL